MNYESRTSKCAQCGKEMTSFGLSNESQYCSFVCQTNYEYKKRFDSNTRDSNLPKYK
jgi:hypothetical protein